MPRLLLVDDNPSIHRIAESLLASTDVELVCVDSAAEALDRTGRGERFDVALIDTAMPGMDGWTLLHRFRSMDETARMPIALMAGVLDPVDPAKLAKAPIQGFLKKPIELRELGDRVKALLVMPVTVSPSPFSTVPAASSKDLVKRAEEALPELRPEPVAAAAVAAAVPGLSEPEDLIVLTAEDLWPEEPAPVAPEAPALPALHDMHLELEELDLDSLQDLGDEALPEPGPAAGLLSAPVTVEPKTVLPLEEEHLVTLTGLEELETLPADFDFLPHPVPEPVAKAAEPAPAHLSTAALLGLAGATGLVAHELAPKHPEPTHAPEPAPVVPEPAPAPHESAPAVPAAAAAAFLEPPVTQELEELAVASPAAGGQVPAAAGHGVAPGQPAPDATQLAHAVVQALLADPALMDVLVKALVARTGDQVLREIAWEVMPDLAGRLQR